MNDAMRIATLVPLTGLIPLGFAILASFARPEPVVVEALRASSASGPATTAGPDGFGGPLHRVNAAETPGARTPPTLHPSHEGKE
jgi:hypothetical protein